jgi:hypothetical protein
MIPSISSISSIPSRTTGRSGSNQLVNQAL